MAFKPRVVIPTNIDALFDLTFQMGQLIPTYSIDAAFGDPDTFLNGTILPILTANRESMQTADQARIAARNASEVAVAARDIAKRNVVETLWKARDYMLSQYPTNPQRVSEAGFVVEHTNSQGGGGPPKVVIPSNVDALLALATRCRGIWDTLQVNGAADPYMNTTLFNELNDGRYGDFSSEITNARSKSNEAEREKETRDGHARELTLACRQARDYMFSHFPDTPQSLSDIGFTVLENPGTGPLKANAGGNQIGTQGVEMTFDGSASQIPQGATPTYTWDFGDGSPTAGGAVVNHTYAVNGFFNVSLTVDTGTRQDTDIVSAAINIAPV